MNRFWSCSLWFGRFRLIFFMFWFGLTLILLWYHRLWCYWFWDFRLRFLRLRFSRFRLRLFNCRCLRV